MNPKPNAIYYMIPRASKSIMNRHSIYPCCPPVRGAWFRPRSLAR